MDRRGDFDLPSIARPPSRESFGVKARRSLHRLTTSLTVDREPTNEFEEPTPRTITTRRALLIAGGSSGALLLLLGTRQALNWINQPTSTYNLTEAPNTPTAATTEIAIIVTPSPNLLAPPTPLIFARAEATPIAPDPKNRETVEMTPLAAAKPIIQYLRRFLSIPTQGLLGIEAPGITPFQVDTLRLQRAGLQFTQEKTHPTYTGRPPGEIVYSSFNIPPVTLDAVGAEFNPDKTWAAIELLGHMDLPKMLPNGDGLQTAYTDDGREWYKMDPEKLAQFIPPNFRLDGNYVREYHQDQPSEQGMLDHFDFIGTERDGLQVILSLNRLGNWRLSLKPAQTSKF